MPLTLPVRMIAVPGPQGNPAALADTLLPFTEMM
jgi:hypothetical protein